MYFKFDANHLYLQGSISHQNDFTLILISLLYHQKYLSDVIWGPIPLTFSCELFGYNNNSFHYSFVYQFFAIYSALDLIGLVWSYAV